MDDSSLLSKLRYFAVTGHKFIFLDHLSIVVSEYAAEGGEIFPRRVGGIMPDDGIPNKDSVRAMLMPGEFVMTTDAVKGLGGGDMNKGISNMYNVMRNLEQRGKAIA